MDISSAMVGACAWIIGEYHDAFEAPADATFVKAAKALLLPKHVQTLEASVQTQCVWAAVKLYLGSPKYAPGSLIEMHELMEQHLPGFIQSTAVDVSERATLSLHLSRFLKADMPKVTAGSQLCDEALLPVHPDAQKAVEMPEGLDLDTPFFAPEENPAQTFNVIAADPADPFALAATYKDDLGLMSASNGPPAAAAAPDASKQQHQNSMFYLQGKDGGASKEGATADGSAEAPPAEDKKAVDPLEAMRQKLMAGRSTGSTTKMEVMRDDVVLPGQQMGAAAAGAAAPAVASSAPPPTGMPTPSEKELTDMEGKLWSVVYKDQFITVYACIRSPNTRKQLMRVDLRCEKASDAPGSVKTVRLSVKDLTVQEAGPDGFLILHEGELVTHSAKMKANIVLTDFLTPRAQPFSCVLQYGFELPDGSGEQSSGDKPFNISVPATNMLVPEATTEDDIAEYIATNAQTLLTQQTAQQLSFELAGKTADQLSVELPQLVGRLVGMSRFFGIQQQSAAANKGQKFLLVAKPLGAPGQTSRLPGQTPLPENAKIVALVAGLPRDGGMDFKLTVKSSGKEVCDGLCEHMVATLKELVEGRLRPA